MKESTPTKLLLVRHGQDQDNALFLINGRRDTALTELGRMQAVAVAAKLRSKPIDCVYTSPLQRAYETAAIISQRLAIAKVHVDPDLIERDYGILTGRSPADIPGIAKKIFVSNNFKYVIDSEGVEDYEHLWARAGVVLRRIQDRHPGQTVVIVAHNEIIKMIRANFNEKSWKDELLLAPIVNCEVIALG